MPRALRPGVMRAALILLLPTLLAAPSAAAIEPARCTEFWCFSLLDDDGDGTPDGVIAGTTTFVHGAPTTNVVWTRDRFFVAGEATAGDEHEEHVVLQPYVGGDRAGAGYRAILVEAALVGVDGETGASAYLARVALRASDRDGDAVPENTDVALEGPTPGA